MRWKCPKDSWVLEIRKILAPEITHLTIPNLDEKLKKILDYIEEIKLNKDQKCCPHGVPISYAKGRIKSCWVKLEGYRIKSEFDLQKFKERINIVGEVPLGQILTVNKSREPGSYGQEFRDVFNYLICMGKLKKVKVKKTIGEKNIEYDGYERIENSQCQEFNTKKIIIKECQNPKCKIKEFPLSQTECCYCRYVKGKKKGQFYPLKVKISNKDMCQLNRGDFKKEKNGET